MLFRAKMTTLPWNPLKKVAVSLNAKPKLTEGMVSMDDDRCLEITYVNLQEMEENSRKIQREVKKYEDCLLGLQRADDKLSSDLANSQLWQENESLRRTSDDLGSLVYQMGHNTDDMVQLAQRTVRDPMKKINGEFPNIQAAIKRRDMTLQEAQRAHIKYEKIAKDITSNNAKKEQAKRCFMSAKEDFEKANKKLLLELPQFYDRRIEYFQPCLQALVRSQVDYYGCSTRLHSRLETRETGNEDSYTREIERRMAEIQALSIVGS